jgi:hypothetical protein
MSRTAKQDYEQEMQGLRQKVQDLEDCLVFIFGMCCGVHGLNDKVSRELARHIQKYVDTGVPSLVQHVLDGE